jgi:hypothetical protein
VALLRGQLAQNALALYNLVMKRIRLTREQYALVDDADYAKLSQHSWYAIKGNNTYYAAYRGPRDSNGYRLTYYMHRVILGLPPYPLDKNKLEVDHANKNGIDNRRSNIRIATKSENALNRDNRKLSNIQCSYCNKVFKPTSSKTKYCSSVCFGKKSYISRKRNKEGSFI